MQSDGGQALRLRIEVSRDGVGREHVCGVRIRVAEKVGEGDGGKRVRIRVSGRVEFDHVGVERDGYFDE